MWGSGFLVLGRVGTLAKVMENSTVEMQGVTAGRYGGGFAAFGDIQVNASKLLIANATAVAWDGGGFIADKSMQVGLSYQ